MHCGTKENVRKSYGGKRKVRIQPVWIHIQGDERGGFWWWMFRMFEEGCFADSDRAGSLPRDRESSGGATGVSGIQEASVTLSNSCLNFFSFYGEELGVRVVLQLLLKSLELESRVVI